MPTRAADALFWAGRCGRAGRGDRRRRAHDRRPAAPDPTLVTLRRRALGDAHGRGVAVGAPVRRRVDDEAATHRGPVGALDAELAAATSGSVDRVCGAFVAEAATVGEFLPSNAGAGAPPDRRLTELFGDGAAPIDVIDAVLADARRVLRACGTNRPCAGRRGGSATSAAGSSGRSCCSALVRACVDVRDRGSRRRRRGGARGAARRRARASSPTAARSAATSSWPPRSRCCSTTATTHGPRLVHRPASPSTSPTSDWTDGSAQCRGASALVAALAERWRRRPAEAVARIGAVRGRIDEFAARDRRALVRDARAPDPRARAERR